MSEMVEKVALAIAHAAGVDPALYGMEPWLKEARAAIQAMREPTPAMRDAGGDELSEDGVDMPHLAEATWERMIDAALSDTKTREG